MRIIGFGRFSDLTLSLGDKVGGFDLGFFRYHFILSRLILDIEAFVAFVSRSGSWLVLGCQSPMESPMGVS